MDRFKKSKKIIKDVDKETAEKLEVGEVVMMNPPEVEVEKVEENRKKYVSTEKFISFDVYYPQRKAHDLVVIEKCEDCGKEFITMEDKTLYYGYDDSFKRHLICSECAKK